MIKQNKNPWYFYIWFFFVFSIFGWLCEILWFLYEWKELASRGFMHGPYLPIYGFGTGFCVLFFKSTYSKKVCIGKLNIKPLLIFLYSFVVLSALEYISAYLLETVFGMRWWSYDNNKFNLHGRICLKNSIFFGIGGVFTMYFAYPFMRKVTNRIPVSFLKISAILIAIIMSADFVLSVIKYLR